MHPVIAAPIVAGPVDAATWDGFVHALGRLGDWALDLGGQMGPYVPIAVAGTVVWLIWLTRALLSWTAPAIESDFRTTTSVVVPSYHEDVDILMDCLATWREQDPTEIIIVLDVADTEAHRRITALEDDRIQPILFHHVGKRSALGVGIRAAQGEILVLVDSDTRWTPGLLQNVQKPFVDPDVGGVSTQQNVYQRTSSLWRRVADWLVNLRYLDYVPAQGRFGAVACLSGRTAAYRASAAKPVVRDMEDEFFLGRRCIAGDDGRLTWLVLASGYRTVHQRSAKALSMFPSTFRAFVKQRVRWSRNSYRCYLTAIFKGWLWRVPAITKVTVLQILLTPVTMGMTIAYLLLSRLELTEAGIVATVLWLVVTRGMRGISHLREHPLDIVILPVVVLVVIFVALPIKVFALVTMNKQGWLTRSAHSLGGDGQTSTTLTAAAPVAEPALAAVPSRALAAEPAGPVDPVDPVEPGGTVAPEHAASVEVAS
ncbi:glycosyltransferase [Brachybacterium alimentarium]|uniref:glycosyltransferase n=1 Tax=Brachybacterium alimentarium TaxID=47845 RepID=UPI0031DFFB0A